MGCPKCFAFGRVDSRETSKWRVYPKLSSIGFMMRASGADRMAWAMIGVKELTVMCWRLLEVDANVDIVNHWVSSVVGLETLDMRMLAGGGVVAIL